MATSRNWSYPAHAGYVEVRCCFAGIVTFAGFTVYYWPLVAGPDLMKSTTQRFSVRPKNRLYLLNVTSQGEHAPRLDVFDGHRPELSGKPRRQLVHGVLAAV